jgi:hypothetical protein
MFENPHPSQTQAAPPCAQIWRLRIATGTWKKLVPDQKEFARLKDEGAVKGKLEFRDNVLICDRSSLTIQSLNAKEAIIRAKIYKPKFVSGTNVEFSLRFIPGDGGLNKFFVGAWCNGDGTFGIGRGGSSVSGWKDLVTCKLEPRNDFFEFAFAIVGDELTAYVDKKRILQTTYKVPLDDVGGIRFGGLGSFKDVEIQVLDK